MTTEDAVAVAVAPAAALAVDGERKVLAGRPSGDPTRVSELGSTGLLEVWGDVDDASVELLAKVVTRLRSTENSVDQLAGALVEANDQLVGVYDLAGIRTQSLDEAEAVTHVLDEACRLLRCDQALVTDGAKRLYRSTGSEDAQWLRSCADSFLANGSPALTDDGAGTAALLVDVSTPEGGNLVLAFARRRDGRFLTGERRLAEAIADTLVGVLNTAVMHQQALVRREHDTAAQLAQSALPRHQPSAPGLDAVAETLPARAAGGDFYTYSHEDGGFYFVVGDVSGKGLPAALVMSTLVSASNAALRRYAADGPHRVLEAIDNDAYDYLSDAGLFATLVVGRIRPSERIAEFANAGHGPVMISKGAATAQIEAAAPPVGVLPIGAVTATSCLVEPGDLVVIGSDGLTEQENPQGEMFGEEQLAAFIEQHRGRPSQDVAAAVLDQIERYADDSPQSDDRTVMVMQIEEDQ